MSQKFREIIKWTNHNQGWLGFIGIIVAVIIAIATQLGVLWLIGVSVVFGLVTIIWFLSFIRNRNSRGEQEDEEGGSALVLQQQVPHLAIPIDDRIVETTRLMPADLINDVDSRPPYQRDLARESYVGRRVEWSVRLINIRRESNTQWRIMLKTSGETNLLWVFCQVNLNNYPELKTVNSETFIIKGVISKFDLSDIDLEEVQFVF